MSETHSNIEVKSGSARGFGLTFAAVFATVGVYPVFWGGEFRWWCLAIAAGFLLVALARPRLLDIPNRWWFRFGMLLGGIVAPVVMGAVYLLAVTPFALGLRALGKRPLDLDFDPAVETYWIRREDEPSSMRNQF